MRKINSHTRLLALVVSTALFIVFQRSSRAESIRLPLDAKGTSVTFFGESFLHDFHGEAKEVSGSAELNPDATPPVQKAALHFETTRLTTFEAARDKKMWSWLKVDAHPAAEFSLDSVKLLGGDCKAADAQHPASFSVAGSFTLNGLKRPMSGTASGWREKGRLIVAGETTIDTLQYGLPQIREMFMTVGTNVKVSYRLSFTLPPEYAAK